MLRTNRTCRFTGLLLTAISLVACGGSGGGNAGTPPPAVDHLAALEARLGNLNTDDYAIVIGDENGILLSREFGNFSVTDS